ncbi:MULTISPECIES: hypothetical protein [unclassified Nostoc]|nr:MULTISPECIES: hypothetical protein [unclassified Nostoc]
MNLWVTISKRDQIQKAKLGFVCISKSRKYQGQGSIYKQSAIALQ